MSGLRTLTRKLWRSTIRRHRHAAHSNASRGVQPSSKGGAGLRSVLASGATCGGLSLCSDVIVQQIEKRSRAPPKGTEAGKEGGGKGAGEGEGLAVDAIRAARMLGFGFFIYGPMQHFWYAFLDRRFPLKANVGHFAAKVALNQVCLAPCVITSAFAWNLILQQKGRQLAAKITDDLVPTMINGWKFWVPAASINFWFVPLPRQVLYMSTCSMFWTGYISYASNKDKV